MENMVVLENREFYVCKMRDVHAGEVVHGPDTYQGCVSYSSGWNNSRPHTPVHAFPRCLIDAVEIAVYESAQAWLKKLNAAEQEV